MTIRVGCFVLVAAFMLPSALFAQSRANEQLSTAGAISARPEPEQPLPEAIVILNEPLFNGLFDAVFTQLKAPSYPLNIASAEKKVPQTINASFESNKTISPDECSNVVKLEREEAGVKSEVHFKGGKITAPLAFSGTYNITYIGCVRFTGWAATELTLYFDQAHQSLSARVSINEIHLSGAPSLTRGTLMSMVQGSLDRKINPLVILQANQLSTKLPIPSSGGSIVVHAREVKPEVGEGEVRIHIYYEFPKP